MADVCHDGLAALRGQLDEVDGDEGEVTEIRATFNNVSAIYLKKEVHWKVVIIVNDIFFSNSIYVHLSFHRHDHDLLK